MLVNIKKWKVHLCLMSLMFMIIMSTIFFIHIKSAQATTDVNYLGEYWNLQSECSESPVFPTSTALITRNDSAVNFDWGSGSPTSSINSDCFAARWTRNVDTSAGIYVFKILIDDGARVYVDNHVVIDQWSDHDHAEFTAPVTLSAGSHAIKIEYYEHFGSAAVKFSYSKVLADPNTWGTNNDVYATAVGQDGTLYLGGSFTYVGPNNGAWAPINLTSGKPTGTFPTVSGGSVYATVSDGAGGSYIGGDFLYVNGVYTSRLAHILSDGSVDQNWNTSGADSTILSLAYSNGVLYVGGYFGNISGQTRYYLAALDGTTGNVTSWNPSPDNAVHSIVVVSNTVYVGGDFGNFNFDSSARASIAALDANTGSSTAWNPNSNSTVMSLAVSGNTIYAGGNFTNIGGASRLRLAAIDATTGSSTAWNPGVNNNVEAILVNSSTVYIGGDFSQVGVDSASRDYIAALDINTGSSTPWLANANNSVYSLAMSGGTLYAGGAFTIIGADGASRNNIAALDTTTGNSTSFDPNANSYVHAMYISGSSLFVGGQFDSIGGSTRNYIAAISSSTGQVTDWNPNADSSVVALNVYGNTVYAGGYFNNIGGAARARIAALDVVTGSSTAWNPGANNQVLAIQANSSTVYIGGSFTNIGATSHTNIAAIDASTSVVSSWEPNADGTVDALVLSGTSLYAGGRFRHIGGQTRGYVAELNTSDGSATSWDASANYNSSWDINKVNAIAVESSTVYIGGRFSSVRGAIRNNIAEVDRITGVPTDWDPNANNPVNTLQVNASTVYVGGEFGSIGGQSRNHMAELSRSTNTNQATDWNPDPDSSVFTSLLVNNKLYIGGNFNYVELLHVRLASFDIKEIQFTTSTGSGSESVSSVIIPVSIDAPQSGDVSVHYSATGGTATGNGTNYTLADGNVTIPAGQTTTSISLAITTNAVLAGDETVIITLSNPTGDFSVGANKTFTYTIKDDNFIVYESHDTAVNPSSPGTLANNNSAAVLDYNYFTTALSETDGGYDSQVFRFRPDFTGITTSTFRIHWVGHGDVPIEKLVHLSIWNFVSSTWVETDSEHCSDDCDLTNDRTGNQYHDDGGNVWVWAKADNQYGPPTISDVSNNNSLLPITWNTFESDGTTPLPATSLIAYDTVSHAGGNWDDYANHLIDTGYNTSHNLSPALYYNGPRAWQAVAASASGTVMIAAVYNGDIFTSVDTGNTWVDRAAFGRHAWKSVSVSGDGTKMAAGIDGGEIYVSGDLGSTWATSTNIGDTSKSWTSIAESSDGTSMAATVWNGHIWTATSTDGLNFTWTEHLDIDNKLWNQISMTPDGSHLVAVEGNNGWGAERGIYVSSDNGANWTLQSIPANRDNVWPSYWAWSSISQSSDGKTLIASEFAGTVWTATSSDGLNYTWTEHPDNPGSRWGWNSVVSSQDGQILAASNGQGNYIWLSVDGGNTWTQQVTPGNSKNWTSISMSVDGQTIVAVGNGDDIYVGTNPNDATSNFNWSDKTGTVWYYRIRSATADGDATTTPEYSFHYQIANSCPFVFSYDGSKYKFVVDASNSANLSNGLDRMTWANTPFYKDPNSGGNYPDPVSFVGIPHNNLAPRTVNGETFYDLKTTTELNETNYYDKAALEIIDHDPSVMVYPDWRQNGQLHSIAKNAPAPVSVTDQDGVDLSELVDTLDNKYWHSSMRANPAYIEIKLVDGATTPANLKLAIKIDKEGPLSNGFSSGDSLQYKTANGQFAKVPADKNIFTVTRQGAPQPTRNLMNTYGIITRVIDLSGLTIKDNTIRIYFTNNIRHYDIDWMAVDTSADHGFTVTTETPYYADLHQRGVSKLVPSNPSDPFMTQMEPDYDQLAKVGGNGNPLTGFATRYGDVVPLLNSIDNKFVIMVQGDELSLKYSVPAQADGTERDFVYYTWDYHKPFIEALGDMISPLPFNEMSQYPYHTNLEHYPTDADHNDYQATYNTRYINWGVYRDTPPPLHHSLNTDFISLTAFAQSGPTIMNVATVLTTTSAAISWDTDISASTRVFYSLDSSFSLSTDETNTSPRLTSHSATLTGLVACTAYHYKVVSIDNIARSSNSGDKTFITPGCSSNVIPSSGTSTLVDTTIISSASLTDSDNTITVTAPANFISSSPNVTIQIKALDSVSVLAGIGKPSSDLSSAASVVFDVRALVDAQTLYDSFDLPVTITYDYSASDVSGLNESSLWMYHYHNGVWIALDSCSVNLSAKTITCTAPSFSTFAIFGQAAVHQNNGGTYSGGGSIPVTPTAIQSSNSTVSPLSFTINDGAKITTDQIVTLNLNADTKTVRGYAVSLNPNFVNASIIPFNGSLQANFTLPNQSGTYTVYLKYYSSTGHSSDVLSNIIIYQPVSGQTSVSGVKSVFKRTLKLGSKGSDVKALQQFLNNHGFKIAKTGVGSSGHETATFGSATAKALIKFQEANAAVVLKPFKLKKGTGIFGTATMKLVNGM